MIHAAPVEDRRVSSALGTSVLLRAADRAINVVWRAAAASRVGMLFSRRARQWPGLAPADRSMAVGVALLAASALHVGLMITHDMPAGWLWLVPPGIAATIGATFVAASQRRNANQ